MAVRPSNAAVTDVEPRMLPVVQAVALSIATSPMPESLERRLVAPGRSLADTLRAEGIGGSGWLVYVGGVPVPAKSWHLVRVKPGQLVEARPVVGKKALALGAILALSYLTFGAGLGAAAAFDLGIAGAFGSVGIAAVQGAIMMGGSMLINKLLGPKPAAAAAATAATTETTFAISAGGNSARLYAPIGLLLGEVKYSPDLAAQQYTWFEGEDQYLACQLHAGINCASVDQVKVGDTLLSQYQDVRLTLAGFPSGNNGAMPSTSVDAIAGALLDNAKTDGSAGDFTTRTTSINTVRVAVDLEFTLTKLSNEGSYQQATVELEIAFRKVGTADWLVFYGDGLRSVFQNASGKPLRRTLTRDVPAGQYEIHIRKVTPNATSTQQQNAVTWTQLKSYQADTADYAGQPRVLVEVKASGQLNGALNNVNWIGRARPLDLWNGQAWVTVTEPGSAGISNPGALLLQLYRGIRRESDGRLIAGYGLPDSRIDMESLKAFMVRCIAKDFRFDLFLQQQMSLQDLTNAIADAGLGRSSRRTGCYGVVWLAEDQPVNGIINMARMKARSFSVDYDLSPTADELEYQFYDAEAGWVQNPVRVMDPTVSGTPQRTASMAVVGITRGAHAAIRARFTLGQSLYARKSITFDLDLEHLNYPSGSVVALSHDLTQWGFSGRLAGFSKTAHSFTLQLDEPLPDVAAPTRMIGLQLPGTGGMRVYNVAIVSADRRTVRVDSAWPDGLAVPGVGRPARDTVWIFDFKAAPGLRARVVSVSPVDDMKGARMVVVPESPEFWNYVWNGAWVQPGNDSLLPVVPPSAGNASITAEQVRVGEAWRTQLTVIYDAAGNYDHAQVWGSADGAPLVLLGETGGTRVSWYANTGRQWSVEVRPFDGLGRLGGRAYASYTVATNAPANVAGLVINMTDNGAVASWAAPGGMAAVDWSLTEIRQGGNFGTAPVIFTGRGTSVPLGWLAAGPTTVWARHKNTAGEWSPEVSTALTVYPPAQPEVVAVRELSLVSFKWPNCKTSQPISHYAISEAVIALGNVTATAYTRNEQVPGRHTYGVVAVDVAGNAGAKGTVVIETLPGFEQAKAELTTGLDGITGVLTGGAPLPAPGTMIRPLISMADTLSQLITGNPTQDPADLLPLHPVGLVDQAQQQQAVSRRTLDSLNQTSESLLRVALDARKANRTMRAAGIYEDDKTGQVRIYGLDHTNERLLDVSVQVDAVKGQVALRATRTEMAQAILAAQLDPTGQVAFGEIVAQVTQIEVVLDSINNTLSLKAAQQTVTELGTKVVAIGQDLDLTKQALTNKVSFAEFQTNKENVEGRIGTAEQTLAAIGNVSSITSAVSQARSNAQALDEDAAARLKGTLAGWDTRKKLREATALATSELRAFVDQNFAAEASRRDALAVELRQADSLQRAGSLQETTARVDGDKAQAARSDQLSVDIQTAKTNLAGEIAANANVAATATEVVANRLETVTAQLEQADQAQAAQLSSTAGALANETAAVAHALDVFTAQMQGDLGELGAQVIRDASASVNRDGALSEELGTVRADLATTSRQLGARIDDTERTLANETGALAESSKTLTAQSRQAAQDLAGTVETQLRSLLGNWKNLRAARAASAQASSEMRALVDGNASAEASRRETLAVELRQADAAQRAAALEETLARVTENKAQVARTEQLAADFATTEATLAGEIRSVADVAATATEVVADQLAVSTAQFEAADQAQTAQLSTTASALANATEAVAHQLQILSAETETDLGTLAAQLSTEASVRATAIAAEAARIDALLLVVDENQAGITSSIRGLVNEQAAQADRIDAVNVIAGDNSASIVVQQRVLAGIAGDLSAIYSLSVTAGGKVTGMVVDGVESTIVFMAGRVAFAAQENGVITYPFIVGQVAGVPTALVDGNFMATGSVKAAALDVQRLSAITAVLGTITGARLEMTGDGEGGWGYVRSYPKWLGDGQNGYILARHTNGQTFGELKAGASRLAFNSDGDYFELSGPWGYLTNGGLTINQVDVIDTLNVRDGAITFSAFAGSNGFDRYFTPGVSGPFSGRDTFSSVGFQTRSGDAVHVTAFFRFLTVAAGDGGAMTTFLTPRISIGGAASGTRTLSRATWLTYEGTSHIGLTLEMVVGSYGGYCQADLQIDFDSPDGYGSNQYSRYSVSDCVLSAFIRRK